MPPFLLLFLSLTRLGRLANSLYLFCRKRAFQGDDVTRRNPICLLEYRTPFRSVVFGGFSLGSPIVTKMFGYHLFFPSFPVRQVKELEACMQRAENSILYLARCDENVFDYTDQTLGPKVIAFMGRQKKEYGVQE